MHDDRQLIEERLQRALRERIRPAIYGAAVPLDIEVWHAPGEPVSPAEALAQTYEPAAIGLPWGPAWGTAWFKFSGQVPAEWAGSEIEAVIDLGFSGGPGFSAEGLVHTTSGVPLKGLHPRQTYAPLSILGPDGTAGLARRPDRVLRRGGREPGGARLDALRADDDIGAKPGRAARRSTADPRRRGRVQRRGLGPDPRPRGAGRPAAAAVPAGAAPPGDPAGAEPRAGRPGLRERRRHRGGRPRAADRRTEPAGARQRAPAVRGRARAHRLGLALAAAGDPAQGGPDGLQRRHAGRGVPGARLRVLAGPAARLGEGQLPGGVGAAEEGRCRRHHRSGGRHVGRVRHQPARWRGAGPAVRARQEVLPGRVRDRHPGGLAAGLVRLHRGAAAAGEAVRVEVVPDPEDLLEQGEQVPAPHLLVGGPRRHPGVHPLPADRHLQLRPVRPRARARAAQLRRERRRDPLAGPVRVRRRRWRPHP